MRAKLHAFLLVWSVLVAAVPLANLIGQGPVALATQVAQARSLGALRAALFNFDVPASWWSRLVWQAGISIDPDQVVIGYNGWLFLGDRYKSTLTATRTGLTPATMYLARRISQSQIDWESWLRGRGVRSFVLMIGPNKDAVYPQFLPDWATARRPAQREALAAGAAVRLYVDPTDELRDVAEREPESLYYRTDTHWNVLGAGHALRVAGQKLRASDPTLKLPSDDGVIVERVGARPGGDLARFLRLSAQLSDRDPVLRSSRPQVTPSVVDYDTREPRPLAGDARIDVDMLKQPILVTSRSALNQRRVLWLRDSFGTVLSPLFSATFSDVIQLHWSEAYRNDARLLIDIVRRWRPEIVLVTVVEREALNEAFATPPPR